MTIFHSLSGTVSSLGISAFRAAVILWCHWDRAACSVPVKSVLVEKVLGPLLQFLPARFPSCSSPVDLGSSFLVQLAICKVKEGRFWWPAYIWMRCVSSGASVALILASQCLSPIPPSVLTSSCVIEALGSAPSDNFNVSTYTAGTVLSTRHVLTHLVFSTTPSDFCYNYNHPFTYLFIFLLT